ncbi:MAG: cell division protein FtsA [Anaerolineae bacterium]|nr:cell division protein FtsA [Thermoflexales bacterium]MDW8406687.1 cell division protein FtsA [Anaerolineae bacterium]
MAEPKIVTAIDVGSSKVVSLVGEAMAEPGEFSVIGVGIVPARGMKRGQVINVAEATAAIRESLDGAERSSTLKINSAIVSISGSHIGSQNSHGAVAISRGDQGVSLSDVNHSLESAQAISVPNNREIIHVIPRHFKVDEQDGVRNPIGMLGFRLEAQAHIVTGATTSIQNLIKCVNAAQVEVSELVLAALGSAEAVLTPSEREMGVVLVDIGNGTTDIAIFIDGAVWHTCVIEVGGSHFTSDLALCLRLPLETAEQIKLSSGHCNPEDLPLDNPFIVAGFGDEERVTIRRRDIAEILHARAEELFGLIVQEIKRSGYDGLLPAGLVITGGGALLPGLRDVARETTQLPVRTAQPTSLHGLVDNLHSPAYATAIGLLKWGLHDIVARPSKRRRPGLHLNLKGWWSNLLPRSG